jgi:Tfp pilus assembly protein FimT
LLNVGAAPQKLSGRARRRRDERSERRLRRRVDGVLSPELLVVIAIMGLFILFAGPSFLEAYRSYRVRSAANNLVTDIRALRYNAVTRRVAATMTINDQASGTDPNTYSFTNVQGQPVTQRFEEGVLIDAASADTIGFALNGGTGSTGNMTVVMNCTVSGSRGDRYTITVTPSGTVTTAYSTFVP